MRKREELEMYFSKYPDVSPELIIKLSVTKYGTIFSDEALARLQKPDYRFTKAEPFGIHLEIRKKDFYTPGAVIFRDGGSVLVNYGEPYADPYVVGYDEQEDVFLLTEDGVVIDTIDFLARPGFFDGVTSTGKSMDLIGGTCTVQRLLINGFQRCRFWEHGEQCHYCALFSAASVLDGDVNLGDITETVREAMKEPGRFTEISVSGGSDFGGEPPFSVEQERYIRVLQAVADGMDGKLEVQMMAPAYKKADIKRIYDNTCLTSYRPNIEVWDADSFRRMCPGKERWIGREEWIRRMCDAVEVFGKGRVYTQMVCGAELAKPHGMTSVEQALESAFEGAEFFSKNGISCHEEVWRPHKGEKLGWQPMQELDYFIRLATGFHDIRRSYGICDESVNYMRGSDNPDADLERADMADDISVQNRFTSAHMTPEEYAAPEISQKLQDMIREKNVQILMEAGDGTAFEVPELVVLDGKYLMVPLETDRSAFSSYMIKALWFKQPITLWVKCGDTAMRLSVGVYRHHLVGTKFRKTLDHVREQSGWKDMLAANELRILEAETACAPKLQIRPRNEIYAHGHLSNIWNGR